MKAYCKSERRDSNEKEKSLALFCGDRKNVPLCLNVHLSHMLTYYLISAYSGIHMHCLKAISMCSNLLVWEEISIFYTA